MSSKRRLRRKGCEGKVRHASKSDGDYAAHLARQKYRDGLFAYRCRFCRGYHVGHRPGRIRRIMEAT